MLIRKIGERAARYLCRFGGTAKLKQRLRTPKLAVGSFWAGRERRRRLSFDLRDQAHRRCAIKDAHRGQRTQRRRGTVRTAGCRTLFL